MPGVLAPSDGQHPNPGSLGADVMRFTSPFRWPLRPLSPTIPAWIPAGTMTQARWGHSATLLPDGRVLVAGGIGSIDTISSAEIYDPDTTNWYPTASMGEPRAFHTATALPGGDVLVTGGIGAAGIYGGPGTPPPPIAAISPRAQVYSPRSGTWHSVSPMTTARFEHTAELLPGGGVFVANGLGGPSDRTEPALVLDSGETFDPVTGRWTTASLEVSRYAATSALLADGRVLLYGGLTIDANNQVAPAIVATVFNPLTNAVDPPRARHTATRVPDGTVLIVGGGTRGGSADNADSDTAEFTDTPTDCVVDRTARFSTVIVSLSQRRHRHTATLLPD